MRQASLHSMLHCKYLRGPVLYRTPVAFAVLTYGSNTLGAMPWPSNHLHEPPAFASSTLHEAPASNSSSTRMGSPFALTDAPSIPPPLLPPPTPPPGNRVTECRRHLCPWRSRRRGEGGENETQTEMARCPASRTAVAIAPGRNREGWMEGEGVWGEQ